MAMLSCACSSSVQDLGRNAPEENAAAATDMPTAHEGFGTEWACPDSPLARDLACPLSRPIDNESCGSGNSAPCAYDSTIFCICTRELRWSCLRDVSMRTLAMPVADLDLCEGSLTIETPSMRCRCENGRMRCAR